MKFFIVLYGCDSLMEMRLASLLNAIVADEPQPSLVETSWGWMSHAPLPRFSSRKLSASLAHVFCSRLRLVSCSSRGHESWTLLCRKKVLLLLRSQKSCFNQCMLFQQFFVFVYVYLQTLVHLAGSLHYESIIWRAFCHVWISAAFQCH